MVCFYHYAQGARVNPPPFGFIFNVCDPDHELKLTLCPALWGFWNRELFSTLAALCADFSLTVISRTEFALFFIVCQLCQNLFLQLFHSCIQNNTPICGFAL